MTGSAIWLFVSYETQTGLAYARLAKARFHAAGYRSWVWHDDRTIGEYTYEEIANEIDRCNHFIYINTADSHTSEGQMFERATAWALKRRPNVLALKGSYISPVLAACNQMHADEAGFERACDQLAIDIGEWQRADIRESRDLEEGATVPETQTVRDGGHHEPA